MCKGFGHKVFLRKNLVNVMLKDSTVAESVVAAVIASKEVFLDGTANHPEHRRKLQIYLTDFNSKNLDFQSFL